MWLAFVNGGWSGRKRSVVVLEKLTHMRKEKAAARIRSLQILKLTILRRVIIFGLLYIFFLSSLGMLSTPTSLLGDNVNFFHYCWSFYINEIDFFLAFKLVLILTHFFVSSWILVTDLIILLIPIISSIVIILLLSILLLIYIYTNCYTTGCSSTSPSRMGLVPSSCHELIKFFSYIILSLFEEEKELIGLLGG